MDGLRSYIGIDPGGSSGCLAYVCGDVVDTLKMEGATLRQIWSFLHDRRDATVAVIEKVNAMPGQGVTSTFSFGKNFGSLLMACTATGIRTELVTSKTWQKALGVAPTKYPPLPKNLPVDAPRSTKRVKAERSRLKREHKLKLRELAERLFPDVKVYAYSADALLLAEYGRRVFGGE